MSYQESESEVTVTVLILKGDNPGLLYDRKVFGIQPSDLEALEE